MKKFKLNDDVVGQEVQGEIVLLHLGTEQYYGLEGTGVLIWRLLEQGLGRDQVLVELQSRFDVPAESLAADLDDLLTDLLRRGLIEPQ